jgi:acetylornithine deacetylase/succinyl-diaminopimelate desuccinylase-like protein
VPLARSIRLMIETTEETGGDGMKYYREKTALPEYNIVLDSKYPAVVAEKGSGALTARFADQAVGGKQAAIVAMSGAASANAIPQTATARISGGDLAAVAAGLEKARWFHRPA